MSNFRSRWLAALAGTTLLALSLSSALAHNPVAGTNTAPQDSVVKTTDNQAGDQTATDTSTQVDVGQPSDHGACVSEVAHSADVGGKNENHGGAVSEAAQVTCVQDPTAAQQADEGQTEVQANDSDDAEVDQSDQPDSGQADAQDHNGGHEGDSSGD